MCVCFEVHVHSVRCSGASLTVLHPHRPMLIDMNKVYRQTNLENLDQAFSVAERDLGVTRLLDPEGMCPTLPPHLPYHLLGCP